MQVTLSDAAVMHSVYKDHETKWSSGVGSDPPLQDPSRRPEQPVQGSRLALTSWLLARRSNIPRR